MLARAAAFAALLAACADPGGTPSAQHPNAGMFRDFLDGKFDAAGHPLNAIVVTGAEACAGATAAGEPGAVSLTAACKAGLPTTARDGELVANVRLRVGSLPAGANALIATVAVQSGSTTIASETLTTARVREANAWIDLPISYSGNGADDLHVTITPAVHVDLDYLELFPQHLGLVADPGSGIYADSDHLTFELPLGGGLSQLALDGTDLTARLTDLLSTGAATRTDTAVRSLVDVSLADLAPDRADTAELALRGAGTSARVELRRVAPECAFEGDPNGTKVLITGFQPFPADAAHDNVSGVAVTSLDPKALRNAQVMRLVLPVEYDRAAAEVADAIARCQPRIAISFGQGGDAIALEEVAYNLQDTGELAGGVPDNRGIVRAAAPIDPAAAATRDTLLPLDAIEHALVAAGEAPEHSQDPGRYVCNNVMFADLGAIASLPTPGRAGFIHLPYTTEFDAATRARFGAVVAAAIQATVDSP